MEAPQQQTNATAGPNETGYAAAGAYVLPAWLTAPASSSAAWVPKPQQGWQVTGGRLWAAISALPFTSLIAAIIVAYVVLHVIKTA